LNLRTFFLFFVMRENRKCSWICINDSVIWNFLKSFIKFANSISIGESAQRRVFFRLEVLRDSVHGLSEVLGSRKDRSRGTGGRGWRRSVQFVLLGSSRPNPNGDIDGRVEEAPFKTHTIYLATRNGWQISVRGPKVYIEIVIESLKTLTINIIKRRH